MRPENVKDGKKLHNKLVIKDLTFSYTWLIINERFDVSFDSALFKGKNIKIIYQY
jgi:hypothetical protein